MAVAAVNIVIEQGTDYQEVFTVNNPDGTPLDLTGHTGVAKIRKYPGSSVYTPFSVGIVSAAGQVVVSLANTITSSLRQGRYYYDVMVISSTGSKSKVVDGMVLVNSTDSITQTAEYTVSDCCPTTQILGETYWVSTNSGIHTISNVGIGTTNPRFKLEVGSVGSSGTSLYVNGDVRITGILSIGQGTITLDGINNTIGIGTKTFLTASGNINNLGVITATKFVGDGSELTGIIAAGSGVNISDDGSLVGTASTINFGANLTVSSISAGVVTVTGPDVSNTINYWTETASGIHTTSSVGIGTTNPRSKLDVEGNVYVSGITTSNKFAVNRLIKFNDTNVSIGDTFTGISNSSGYGNVFVGTSAGKNNTIGASNNFIGDSAGYNNTMGSNNNFFGVGAGYTNSFGFNNNFFGYSCGYNNSEGYYNNFIGDSAGYSNTFGNFNNFFGKNAGYNNQTGSYNIAIGYNVNLPVLNGDNQLVIGKNANNWIVGNSSFNVGIGTTNPTRKLEVQGGDLKVGLNTSSGIILTDANGVSWRLIVNTNGSLSTVAV